ncbi:MAG: M23 family metallopeptidase, partial [Pseudomonadota bacterium]
MVFLRRAALAGCALLIVAAAVKYGSRIETSTAVVTPSVAQADLVTPPQPAALPAPAIARDDVPPAVPPVTLAALSDDDITVLRARTLTLPVQGISTGQLADTYSQARAAGAPHEALDIMAARGTPVLAVEDGPVARLFLSKPGGITLYQFDPTSQYAYYYAHLDRYADGVAEGATLRKGQVIGFVGSTGNASADAPHLHFA